MLVYDHIVLTSASS